MPDNKSEGSMGCWSREGGKRVVKSLHHVPTFFMMQLQNAKMYKQEKGRNLIFMTKREARTSESLVVRRKQEWRRKGRGGMKIQTLDCLMSILKNSGSIKTS